MRLKSGQILSFWPNFALFGSLLHFSSNFCRSHSWKVFFEIREIWGLRSLILCTLTLVLSLGLKGHCIEVLNLWSVIWGLSFPLLISGYGASILCSPQTAHSWKLHCLFCSITQFWDWATSLPSSNLISLALSVSSLHNPWLSQWIRHSLKLECKSMR